MANVIREDIIKVEYDVDDGGLSASIKLLEKFKEGLLKNFSGLLEPVNKLKKSFSVFETSGLDDIKDSTKYVKDTVKDLENGVRSVKEEFSAGIDTSVIDGVKKSTEQTNIVKLTEVSVKIEKPD